MSSLKPHCLLTGRGGQSALRFARLRMEKRHNYVRKVAEVAVQLFITNDKPNISGLVLAGSADFKTELSQSDMFDPVSYCFFSRLSRAHFLGGFGVCQNSQQIVITSISTDALVSNSLHA